MASLGRQRLGDGNAFHKADDRYQQGRDEQRLPKLGFKQRDGKWWQALRNVPDDPDSLCFEVKRKDRECRESHRKYWSRLGDQVSGTRRQTHAHEQRLQAFAYPEQKRGGGNTDDQRRQVRPTDIGEQGRQQFGHGFAMCGDAQQRFQLAGSDDDPAGGDEPGHDRVREQVGQESETQHAHYQQDQTRKQREYQRSGNELGATRSTDIACCSQRHQRNHRNWSDRECPARPQQGIGDDRQHRRVESDFRGQACQHRIGEALRDEHDRHDQCRDHVVGQRMRIITASPLKDRKVTLELHGQNQSDWVGGVDTGCARPPEILQ